MKDEKGHGSNSRGGSYPNIDKNLRGAGKHVGYAGGENFNIQKSNGSKSAWYSAVGNAGTVFSGKGLGEISGKLTDHAAAAELARGSQKSDAVPVHSGAGGPQSHFPITLIGDKGHADAQRSTVNKLLRRG